MEAAVEDVLLLRVVETLVLVVDGFAGAELPLPLPLPVPALEKVLPISPHFMLEKVTAALGEFFSTSVGVPELVEHGPRLTPGWLGSAVVG